MVKENKFEQLLQDNEFLVMAHRGLWHGNIIQNTRESVYLAKKAGADIAEIDICKSKDGVYYLFHSGYEKALLNTDKPFAELTATELDKISLRNSIGKSSGYYLNRFQDFLEWLPKDILVNVDRSWWYWADEKLFDLVGNSGKSDQLFFKSRAMGNFHAEIDLFSKNGHNYNFVPIIKQRSALDYILDNTSINVIGVELVIESNTSELLAPGYLASLAQTGLLVVANSETLGENILISANIGDDVAILADYDKSWGVMIENGVNVILTDWPNFLEEYRMQRKNRLQA